MAPLWQAIERRLGSLTLAGGLLAITVAINFFGILSIVSARRAALEEARQDVQLETIARARALEAGLAACRADLLFLAGSPPLAALPAALAKIDPTRVRWGRLDAEGNLLLFLQSHPEVSRLVVRGSDDAPLMVAGRREGAPVMQSPLFSVPPVAQPGRLIGRWQLGGGVGSLEAEVDAGALLAGELTPESGLSLQDAAGQPLIGAVGVSPDIVSVSAPLRDEGWSPPLRWTLVRSVHGQRLVSSVSRLASRYRINLFLNLAVMTLAVLLGMAGLRQARRTALLAEQAAHNARVRELERQLFHTERLSTVGRLAAGMAHEVNNPLEGMANYLRLLEEDLETGRVEEARRALPRLKEGLERAAGIIRQVLQLSNPASAPLGPVDVAVVLAEAVRFVRDNREFRGVEFVTDLPRELPAVTGNRLLLGQLFLNLLLNACQVQPGGGTVEVTAAFDGEKVVARVADRGPGIPESERERVFEPFYSSRHSTGLGLSVCQRIAAQHGSALRLQSRPGGGAEFSIELRKHAADA